MRVSPAWYRQCVFDLQGNLGRLSGLLAGSGLAMGPRLRDGDLKARAEGILASFRNLSGSCFSIEVSGPGLDRIGPIFGTELPVSESFALTGSLMADAGSFNLLYGGLAKRLTASVNPCELVLK